MNQRINAFWKKKYCIESRHKGAVTVEKSEKSENRRFF